MIKSVIFDMDGVLVDNRDIHLEAFVMFLQRYGISSTPHDLTWILGQGNYEIIPKVVSAELLREKGVKALSDEKEQIYREIFENKIVPMPGLINLLKDLRAHGITCAVGSSGNKENVEFVLRKCGITEYFSAVVNGDMVERAKPAPDIFLLASQLLSTPPQECLVIEDSFAGIEAAHSAGMRVISMSTTFSKEELSKVETIMTVTDFRPLSYQLISTL